MLVGACKEFYRNTSHWRTMVQMHRGGGRETALAGSFEEIKHLRKEADWTARFGLWSSSSIGTGKMEHAPVLRKPLLGTTCWCRLGTGQNSWRAKMQTLFL